MTSTYTAYSELSRIKSDKEDLSYLTSTYLPCGLDTYYTLTTSTELVVKLAECTTDWSPQSPCHVPARSIHLAPGRGRYPFTLSPPFFSPVFRMHYPLHPVTGHFACHLHYSVRSFLFSPQLKQCTKAVFHSRDRRPRWSRT